MAAPKQHVSIDKQNNLYRPICIARLYALPFNSCLAKIYFYLNRKNEVLDSWSWNFGLGLGLAHKILVLSQSSCWHHCLIEPIEVIKSGVSLMQQPNNLSLTDIMMIYNEYW